MKTEKTSIWNLLYRSRAHHIFLWVVFFVAWTIMSRMYYPSYLWSGLVTFIYMIFNMACFYVTAYFLFPRYLYTQRYVMFSLLLVLLITVLSVALGCTLHLLFQIEAIKYNATLAYNIGRGFNSNIFIVIVLAIPKLIVEKVRTDKGKLETELQFLKAQVNPHFLFNSINSIYFLIKKNPDEAANTLIRLSDLLRFQLYDCSSEKIFVEKELEYLENYVALEKVRKGERVKVVFNTHGNLRGFTIAPFLLIPFLENAFKYVSNFSNRDNHVIVTFSKVDDRFVAEIANTVDQIKYSEVGGIGLRNVKRRLELLYPGRHVLDIKNSEEYFSVNLSLQIS